MKALLSILCLALLVFFSTSCQSSSYVPAFVLSLHEFSSPTVGEGLTKGVRNSSRDLRYTIDTVAFLDARCFLDGEVYGPNEEGKYGLRISVEMWYLALMHHTAGSNLGVPYAVVVDGTYIGFSHFSPEMRDQDILIIEPLWNLYDATKIAENIKSNHDHFNHWHTKPFLHQ